MVKCHQCQRPIRAPAVLCVVTANVAEWPRLTVYFASLLPQDPEPVRPVCDFFFPLCSAACAATWWGYVHQVMEDKLERRVGQMNPAEVLRVH